MGDSVDFDPNVRKAWSLPTAFYGGSRAHSWALTRIFPPGLANPPRGPSRRRPRSLPRGPGGDVDLVERKDQVIVESVQRGVRARLYRRAGTFPVGRTASTTSTACSPAAGTTTQPGWDEKAGLLIPSSGP